MHSKQSQPNRIISQVQDVTLTASLGDGGVPYIVLESDGSRRQGLVVVQYRLAANVGRRLELLELK